MNRSILLRGLLAKEVRTMLRDRQQVLGLGVFAVGLSFVAYMMESGPPTVSASGPPLVFFVTYPRLMLLAVAVGLSSFVSFVAIPLALATFVGEKEERTLEVLLAAPIPDRTLYWFKCLGIVLPMAGVGYLFLAAAALYGVLLHPGYFASLPVGELVQTVLLSVPFPLLATALQVGLAGSISVWADSKKGAEQLFGAVMTALLFGGALTAFLVSKSPLGEPLVRFGLWWFRQPFAVQYGSLVGLIVIGDVALLGIGSALFQRERLVT
jgi:ABC-type Na+ efflux pump permease subunit